MPEGIFKCMIHDFGTDEPSTWQEHLSQVSHTTSGVAPCRQCGVSTSFTFTGKSSTTAPALCADCKSSLLGDNPP